MTTNSTYILRGLDGNGRELFYTGRVGDGWVSPHRAEAFTYETLERARYRATFFNRMVDVHGVWFLAVPRAFNA